MRNEARKLRSIALLALLLVLGPLQAQAFFACEMTGTTHEECCCDDLEGASGLGLAHAQADPCCEQIVEVRADPDAAEVARPVEVRSDVDPPKSIVASGVSISFPVIVLYLVVQRNDDDHFASGRLTYLITQRLRI